MTDSTKSKLEKRVEKLLKEVNLKCCQHKNITIDCFGSDGHLIYCKDCEWENGG